MVGRHIIRLEGHKTAYCADRKVIWCRS